MPLGRISGTRLRITGLAILLSLGCAGVSAQAGLIGTARPDRATAPPAPTGFEAQDHFPGAALFYAADDDAAPPVHQGATGTADLPDLPIPDGASIDDSIRPAPPFRLAGSRIDRERALQCLATAIYYEAATEPDDGQRGVAQVILNRVRHPSFPNSVCGVVYQGSARPGCQFSFACDGSMARRPSAAYYARARRVAQAALDGDVFAPVGMATHYHTHAVKPSWNRSLVMTGVFGAHFFHRWKGWWGTPAAFTQAHSGREPMPGPHAPVAVAQAAHAADAAIPARTAAAGAAGANGSARAPATILPAAPQSGDVLERWAHSGQPIR